jgi:hypothetical protein
VPDGEDGLALVTGLVMTTGGTRSCSDSLEDSDDEDEDSLGTVTLTGSSK